MRNIVHKSSFDSIFGDFFDSFDSFFGVNSLSTDRSFFMSRTIDDVEDIEGGKRISIAVPGRTKENIMITVEDGDLKISTKKTESNFGRLVQHFCSSEFATVYDVSEFDEKNIEAKVENGILTIDLKYKEISPKTYRQIPVK